MQNQLTEIALEAGAKLLAMQDGSRERFGKGPGDFATDADFAAQDIILSRLQKHFPQIGVLAEEQETHKIPGDTFFTIDPLDGTFNYALGTDTWGVLLSYIENARPVCGIAFVPAKRKLVAATRGLGCTVNGNPARLQAAASIAEGIVNMDLGAWLSPQLAARYAVPIIGKSLVVRSLGCAAANFVELAIGASSAAVNINGAKIWDLAPGHVIISEAGGLSCDLSGDPLRWDAVAMTAIFAANAAIKSELLAAFAG